ncbi:hypothetical protein C2857_006800 [Epichloe festucae Fl1]|uniref:Uncharacterized protein n=1 Tax=Epichloe festucae (strain Fl1) TaxID=877507 RepID=A0A7S9KLX4_EPIFF|nr:hypothetical protein C2857_006800 [Epichloe festucae Fl1]
MSSAQSIFPASSNEHLIIQRFQTHFLPVLPAPLKTYFLTTFPWRSLAFRPSTIHPSSHRLAKAIRIPSVRWNKGYVDPASLPAVANVAVLQCIWGHRVEEQLYYAEVKRHWGGVLALLPSEPCGGLDFEAQLARGRERRRRLEEARRSKGEADDTHTTSGGVLLIRGGGDERRRGRAGINTGEEGRMVDRATQTDGGHGLVVVKTLERERERGRGRGRGRGRRMRAEKRVGEECCCACGEMKTKTASGTPRPSGTDNTTRVDIRVVEEGVDDTDDAFTYEFKRRD